ncbi:MAG: DUF3365 domain-containing protein [Betaproteobacteria bacterium]|nr:DUF3365 domain-containing protein [Betaproteobacteria bacterium]
MTFWKRLPIAIQFLALLLLCVALGAISVYRIGAAEHIAEARNQARTVADMVDNVGTWASQYAGIWVKSDPTGPGFKVGDFLERDIAYPRPSANMLSMTQAQLDALERSLPAYHHKNPALVQRELSDVTQASPGRAKFRMTSDKFMNPNNAPNRFESAALETLRHSQQKEYFETDGDELLYARKLVASAACLKCHDTPENAPEAIRIKYGKTSGFGYKQGEIAGVISVAIPLEYAPTQLIGDFGKLTWVAIATFAASMLLLWFYIRSAIINPVKQLQTFAEKAADAEPGGSLEKPQFDADEDSSDNEIHQLSAAIKAMHDSTHEETRTNPGSSDTRRPTP